MARLFGDFADCGCYGVRLVDLNPVTGVRDPAALGVGVIGMEREHRDSCRNLKHFSDPQVRR